MQLRDLFDDFPLDDADVVQFSLQQILRQPLDIFVDPLRTEQLLLQARDLLPERLEVRVALYKWYAYSNRFDESLALINDVLERAAQAGGFATDWRLLTPQSANWQIATGTLRLYLYSLKATGFVCLRKGDLATACAVLEKLQQLDPQDQVGGSVVYGMAQRLADQALEDEQV